MNKVAEEYVVLLVYQEPLGMKVVAAFQDCVVHQVQKAHQVLSDPLVHLE